MTSQSNAAQSNNGEPDFLKDWLKVIDACEREYASGNQDAAFHMLRRRAILALEDSARLAQAVKDIYAMTDDEKVKEKVVAIMRGES